MYSKSQPPYAGTNLTQLDLKPDSGSDQGLDQERSLYQLGFEYCQDAIFVHELLPDGNASCFTEVNLAACQILGYTRAELLQRSPQEIDITNQNYLVSQTLKRERNSWERLLLAKCGEQIPVTVNVKISVVQGKRIVLFFARDMRDRKQTEIALEASQDQFRAVLEAIPGYVSWISTQGYYLGVNSHLANTLSMSSEQFIGQEVGFKGNSAFTEFVAQFIDSPDLSASTICTGSSLDQTTSYLIAAQKYQNGQAIVTVGIDISEQEAAKAALKELNLALETKVRERTAELTSVNYKLTKEIEERQRIETSLGVHLKGVETAYRMVFAMNQADTLEDIYNRSMRGLMSVFQVQRLGILLSDERGVLRVKIANGVSDELCKAVEKFEQIKRRELGYATQPMLYFDTLEAPFPRALQAVMQAEGINSLVVFPLIHCGASIGEIVIYSDRPLEFTEEEVQLGKTLATYIAVALTRKQTEISLRKSEGQFRQIFRDASIGMALANIRTRRFTKVNSALCHMLKFTEVEFISLAIDDITHPHDFSQDMRHLLQVSYGKAESYRLEKRFLKKSGEVIWANSTVTVLRDADGHPTSILLMVEDISDRKVAEDQARRTEALSLELEKEKELNSLRTRFFSMASHEFRTPIGAILMNANILEYANDTALNLKSRRSLERIRSNIKHLIALLDDVLTINRADTGRLEFRPQLLDVRELCAQVIEESFTQETLPSRVKFSAKGDRPYLAMIDEKLFHHLFSNLLSNAIKYSPENSDIYVELEARELGKIMLQIRDQGIGIGNDDRAHLFEAFYRGQNVGKVTGSGLGLTIVKKSVEMHGGTIEVHSKVGEGTVFTINLPTTFP